NDPLLVQTLSSAIANSAEPSRATGWKSDKPPDTLGRPGDESPLRKSGVERPVWVESPRSGAGAERSGSGASLSFEHVPVKGGALSQLNSSRTIGGNPLILFRPAAYRTGSSLKGQPMARRRLLSDEQLAPFWAWASDAR